MAESNFDGSAFTIDLNSEYSSSGTILLYVEVLEMLNWMNQEAIDDSNHIICVRSPKTGAIQKFERMFTETNGNGTTTYHYCTAPNQRGKCNDKVCVEFITKN